MSGTLNRTARELLRQETSRISRQINLVCNENVLSFAGEEALFSRYYSRYLLGRPDERGEAKAAKLNGLLLGNLPNLSLLEARAHQTAKQLFRGTHIESRFLSGLHATTSVILALTDPGARIWSLHPTTAAGHFATHSIVERTGREHGFLPWDSRRLRIDTAAIADLDRHHLPQMIFLDCGAPLFPLNLEELRDATWDRTTIVYDSSHSLGLIAGNRFQSPLNEGADLLQGNTHKSFPGPSKAISITNDKAIHEAISQTLSRALVSSQDTAASAALHVTLLEMEEFAEDYADAMMENAQLFGRELRRRGLKLFEANGTFTESHIILVVFDSESLAFAAAEKLISAGIICNARSVYGVPTVRIGMQEITRRGIAKENLVSLAHIFVRAIDDELTAADREILFQLATDLSKRKFGWDWANEAPRSADYVPFQDSQ